MSNELGGIAKQLFELKQKKADINAQLKLLNAEIKKVEIVLLKEMQDQDLTKVSGSYGTVYVSTQVTPSVVNWDAFYKYIQEHGYFHMLERRPSRLSFREAYEMGEQVPGVDPVVFDEVRTRKS